MTHRGALNGRNVITAFEHREVPHLGAQGSSDARTAGEDGRGDPSEVLVNQFALGQWIVVMGVEAWSKSVYQEMESIGERRC